MYSVRMRAEKDTRHISGAERLVEEIEISDAVFTLIARALSHDRGKPDYINISIDALKLPVKYMASLPVTLLHVENAVDGKNMARRLLSCIGVPLYCIEKAISLLENGPCDGESMRGAIVMDMQGNRLEPDKQRGIRASRVGITKDASIELAGMLSKHGLSSCYTHVSEALVLATKVASIKGTIAELCWSDDPSYTAGYVSSKKLGYMRIPHMKDEGDCRGGRVFFVGNIDPDIYIQEIEKSQVLVNKLGGIREISNNLDKYLGE